MYKLTLQRWIEGRINSDNIDSLVTAKWLTFEQGETIKNTERVV